MARNDNAAADRISVLVPDLRCASVAGFGLSMLPATPKPPLHWAEPLPLGGCVQLELEQHRVSGIHLPLQS